MSRRNKKRVGNPTPKYGLTPIEERAKPRTVAAQKVTMEKDGKVFTIYPTSRRIRQAIKLAMKR